MIYFKEMLYPEIIRPSRFMPMMRHALGTNLYTLKSKKYSVMAVSNNGNLRKLSINAVSAPKQNIVYSFNKQSEVSIISTSPNFRCSSSGVYTKFKLTDSIRLLTEMGIETYYDLVNGDDDIINFHLILNSRPTIKIYSSIEQFIKEVGEDAI